MRSRLVGRPRKKWIDSPNECLKKRGLNVGQPRRTVYECRRFVSGDDWDLTQGMDP